MFFILSKVLLFLIQPFNWVILLSLFGVITKDQQKSKRRGIAALVVFLIFSNAYLIQRITLYWQAKEKEMKAGEQYEVGILLTGFASFNINTGKAYFKGASDRFIQTARLYHQGHIKKIIVSGGNSSIIKSRQKWKEGDFVAEQLQQLGIPEKDILKDNQSRNTHENGLFSKRIIDSLKIPPPYLLITSATHIPRAQHVFNKVGLPTTAYPCHFTVIDNPVDFPGMLMPSLEAFDLWNTFMKENVGLLMYKLSGKA
jgi:uncharacterized SAM-binding protein YcdF (DUF218 family)